MIICMSDIICITKRSLCCENFLQRIEKIAACHPGWIILREKDLSRQDYEELAVSVIKICQQYDVECALHSHIQTAIKLGVSGIHLPLPLLRTMSPQDKTAFQKIGASCHSIEEVLEAQSLGCTYITAGHVFETDCKKGLPGRGLTFLKNVCDVSSVPVYAIGGIREDNASLIRHTGTQGICLMSSLMNCENVSELLSVMEQKLAWSRMS